VSVYNLALLDGKPAASYFLFRRAVEAGARPAAVLVDFQPECMFQDSRSTTENRNWKALLSPRECLEMAWVNRDADFFATVMLSPVLPSWKCRAEVREAVRSALDGRATRNPEENAKVRRNRRRNRGGLLLPRQTSFGGEVPPAFAAKLFSDVWVNR